MTEEEDREPEAPSQDKPREDVDPVRRATLKGPGGNTEKALGLEMARLVGMNPRLLVAPPSRPAARPEPQDDDAAEGGDESADDDGQGSD